jgi:hypothetical protein
MTEDLILEEIHRIRQQLLEECGGDLQKLLDRIEAEERKDRERLVGPEEFKKRKTLAQEPTG